MTVASSQNVAIRRTTAAQVGTVDAGVNARLLAFYLPQFHPIPENDQWWGPGFTEWTNVARARPLFRGHYQPRLPADLGFYDLRVPEVREQQAELARNAGIEGFVYYHYWFGGGRRLLERPFTEVVASGTPKFPFCLCWANESWSGVWHGAPDRVLAEQTYPGREDNRKHFFALLDAFGDERYVKVDGKPLFIVYRPHELKDRAAFIEQWRDLAEKNGLPGFHFVALLLPHELEWNYREDGFDGALISNTFKGYIRGQRYILYRRLAKRGLSRQAYADALMTYVRNQSSYRLRKLTGRFTNVINYADAMTFFLDEDIHDDDKYACVIPNWDNTPRSGERGIVLHNATPALFRKHLHEAVSAAAARPLDRRIVFVKSWNEWAEGNYLEPDQRFGHGYLSAVRDVLTDPTLVGAAR